jgi:hypothetical protein
MTACAEEAAFCMGRRPFSTPKRAPMPADAFAGHAPYLPFAIPVGIGSIGWTRTFAPDFCAR